MHWQQVWKALKNKLPGLSDSQLQIIERVVNTKPENFSPTNFTIPEAVGTSAILEEPAEKKIVIRFDSILENECNWTKLDQTKVKAMLSIFGRLTAMKVGELPHCGLVRKELDRSDPRYKSYQSLFLHIPPDVVIKEIELPEGGRIFFYMRGEQCFIASIETQHRSIDR